MIHSAHLNNRFLMSYEYNKVMNEFFIFLKARTGWSGRKWRCSKKKNTRELSRKHSLFRLWCLRDYNMLHVYLNMGLRLAGKIYMSNAILMTHHLSHIRYLHFHDLFTTPSFVGRRWSSLASASLWKFNYRKCA